MASLPIALIASASLSTIKPVTPPCCGIINRGAAIYDGKIFRTTLDTNVIALDAQTGKELWRKNAIDFKNGYAMTVAPLVADGVVITGISGGEFGIRGFIDGWDPKTGEHLWRTYTIPGPGEPGNETWPGDTWKHGGAPTWVTGSFDPELRTVYWGTGNAGSFNAALRQGDNLYTSLVRCWHSIPRREKLNGIISSPQMTRSIMTPLASQCLLQ
jgi:alcohol dehydrogenase (cytochrome c)